MTLLFLDPVWLPGSSVAWEKWSCALMLQISYQPFPPHPPSPATAAPRHLFFIPSLFLSGNAAGYPWLPFGSGTPQDATSRVLLCEFSPRWPRALGEVCVAPAGISGSAFAEGLPLQGTLPGARCGPENSREPLHLR